MTFVLDWYKGRTICFFSLFYEIITGSALLMVGKNALLENTKKIQIVGFNISAKGVVALFDKVLN